MTLQTLQTKIKDKTANVAVIGLGYVGLPVACIFARAGFNVTGIDVKQSQIEAINAGHSPIQGKEPGLAELLTTVVKNGKLKATPDYKQLKQTDIILVAVDTPVDNNHQPQYTALKAAVRQLGTVLQPGCLIIIESTVAPGTINSTVLPLLEQASGLKANHDFYIGACPERVMPGKLLANLQKMSRVCGGGTPETSQVMITFYRHIVEADLDAADITTAELVKTVENTYRDVQIAFANEVAKICEANGADVWQVRELVNKSPGRNMHRPGAGVGGHCIPKDPWLLAYAASDAVPLKLIPAARAVNDGMPHHVANIVIHALTKAGQVVSQARVGVLGYAYLENSDDTRHSPSASLVAYLHNAVSDVYIHDPWVKQYQGDLYEQFEACHILVLMVKHDQYRDLDLNRLKKLMRTPILVDGRGFFNPATIDAAGFIYWGLGRG